MPTFSVITVSLDRGDSITKTLDSVEKQSFRDFEYLVIDGDSSDGTPEILEAHKNMIDCLVVEPDNGIFDAMNKGIKYSKGDYIIFLNAGDHFTTDYSLDAISMIIQNNTAELHFGKILWVDPTNRIVISSKHEHVKFTEDLKNENFPHPATIYSRKVFEKYGLFDTAFPVFADYEWNLRALVGNRASFSYSDVVVTTFYTGGISNNMNKQDEKNSEKEQIKKIYFTRSSSRKSSTLFMGRERKYVHLNRIN